MIVSIETCVGTKRKKTTAFGVENCFDFNGPNIDVSMYKFVSVVDCYIQTDTQTVNNLVTLCTSIVDCSSANPNQEIYKFIKTKKSNILYDKPTHSEKYKMQCFSLSESVFTLSLFQPVKNIKVRLRLEFSKCHTDSARAL